MSLIRAEAVLFVRVVGGVVVEVSWCVALVCVVGVIIVGGNLYATHRSVVGFGVMEVVRFAALVDDVIGSVLEGQLGIGVEVIMIVEEADAVSVLVLSHCLPWCSS